MSSRPPRSQPLGCSWGLTSMGLLPCMGRSHPALSLSWPLQSDLSPALGRLLPPDPACTRRFHCQEPPGPHTWPACSDIRQHLQAEAAGPHPTTATWPSSAEPQPHGARPSPVSAAQDPLGPPAWRRSPSLPCRGGFQCRGGQGGARCPPASETPSALLPSERAPRNSTEVELVKLSRETEGEVTATPAPTQLTQS